jgi:hypothetical protein
MEKNVENSVKYLEGLFENNKQFLTEKFIKIKDSIDHLMRIDDQNILELAKIAPYVHTNLIAVMYSEKNILIKLKKKKTLMEQEYLSKTGNSNLNKWQTEKVVNELADIKDINQKIENQEIIVSYLEDSVKVLSNFGFNIKNCVELYKLEKL